MGFSLKQRIEGKNALWAIAFSPEIYVEEQKPETATRTAQDTSHMHQNSTYYQSFVTCGGPRVMVYDYQSRSGDNHKVDRTVRLRRSYQSSDRQEDFYAVTFAWRNLRCSTINGAGNREQKQISKQVVCVGGAREKIFIIDVETFSLQATLRGSISYISDLKYISCGNTEKKYNLLCSATRHQIRVWNLDTLANVCIFAGDPNGHIGDVLSVAWHPTGSRIVSGGGDSPDEEGNHSKANNGKKFQICVWNVMGSKRLEEAIQASSYLPDFANDRSQFNPHIERFAAVVHDDVHSSKVDCVAWLGDLVMSKSVYDEIILWQPVLNYESGSSKSSILPIKTFRYEGNDSFYFVRFALSLNCSSPLLAIGNNHGQVYLWDVNDFDNDSPLQILQTSNATIAKKPNSNKQHGIIRGLAFSPDGQVLVGCDANGVVCYWDNI